MGRLIRIGWGHHRVEQRVVGQAVIAQTKLRVGRALFAKQVSNAGPHASNQSDQLFAGRAAS